METNLGTSTLSGKKLKTLHGTPGSKDVDVNVNWVDSRAVKRAIVEAEHKTAKALAIVRRARIL